MSAVLAEKLLNFEEYLYYDDGTDNRYELIDGELALMPPPTILHMLIAKYLESCFDHEIERLGLPWKTFREAGVRTAFRRSRNPDVCVVTAAQTQALLHRSGIFEEAPLLVVEVVSEASVTTDYRYKRSEYAVAEIGEYWIVDPLESKISVLRWEEGLYESEVYRGEEVIVSRVLPELRLPVAAVLNPA